MTTMATTTAATGCATFWTQLLGGFAAPAGSVAQAAGAVAAAQQLGQMAGAAASPATATPGAAQEAGSIGQTAETGAAQAGSATPGEAAGACCPPPDWMPIAIGEHGVTEYAGTRMNPRIAEYFKAARFWGKDDSGKDNAWCASLVAFVMKKAGYNIATEAYRAKEWANRWNDGKSVGRPIYGAIAVKTRAGGGHVGFVMGSVKGKPGYLAILGGNQSNTTNVSEYPASDFFAFMVPKSYNHSCCELTDYTGLTQARGSET
ncbi:MAG: TIGR02594 family protein [Paracoccus sp. (in: a-proteobacteria)]|nr:TIGR02594 family protein [Paracoccus sp. (in: a-proteobacteria)]